MITVTNELIPGSNLPGKGRILLTQSSSFNVQIFTQPILLFRNPDKSGSPEASLGFMPDDILQKSFERLIRDHYAPFTGWFEMDGTDIYLAWDNYKGDVYSPVAPISFETSTIDASYDEFYNMLKTNDSRFSNSKVPSHAPLPAKGTPLMYVKFTRLGPDNQALAISITASHMLGDGCTFSIMCNGWASIYRQFLTTSLDLLHFDQFNYTIPRPPLFGSVDLRKYRTVKENDEQAIKDKEPENSFSRQDTSNPEKLVDVGFTISLSKQNEIREEAHKEGVSFNVYLFGILWKELVTIYHYHNPHIIDNVSHFNVIVDTRSKFGLPMEVCTDASVMVPVGMTVKDIIETDKIDIAKRIKLELTESVTPEKFCKIIDGYTSLWEQACCSEGDASVNFNRLYLESMMSIPNFVASSWLNIKQPDTNFGSGNPVGLHLQNSNLNGTIFISPSDPEISDGSILIIITLPENYDISRSSLLSEVAVRD